MKTTSTATILIADDNPANLLALQEILASAGYEVLVANNGRTVLDLLDGIIPDLILLDIVMPDISGIEICAEIQNRPNFANLPVIFITAHQEASFMVRAFEAGGVDYVTKPFNKLEILARVRTHLRLHRALLEVERLHQFALDCNPLTKLPGNTTIQQAIRDALEVRRPVVVVYADIDNFKAFNDTHGFAAGDEVIQFTAKCICTVLGEHADENRFVGHIGGDDFLFFCHADEAEALVKRILDDFDTGITQYYSCNERETGFIYAANRRGNEERFAIMTLSMGGVDLRHEAYHEPFQVSEACVEVKKHAKNQPGSCFFLDRRRRTDSGRIHPAQ